jgi:hypothetical protein
LKLKLFIANRQTGPASIYRPSILNHLGLTIKTRPGLFDYVHVSTHLCAQRPAQHLLPPSSMYYICATIASAFILRRCAPVTLFIYQARRLFERACRTGACAITPCTHARQCLNSLLAFVGAFQFARKNIAWDFRIFVNKIDVWLHFLLVKVRNLVRTFVEECRICVRWQPTSHVRLDSLLLARREATHAGGGSRLEERRGLAATVLWICRR